MSRSSPPRNDRFEDYVPVAERLEKFYEKFPDGRVITHLIEHNMETGFVLMRAEVYRSPDDAQPAATGHAFEVRGDSYVNKTSYAENCETGAVGRALAMLGFEVKRGIASREDEDMERGTNGGGSAPAARGASTPRAIEFDEHAAINKQILTVYNELCEMREKLRENDPTIKSRPGLWKLLRETHNVEDGLNSLDMEQKKGVLGGILTTRADEKEK